MRYTRNVEYLVSAVLYMGAYRKYWGRTASNLAEELSLDRDKIQAMFVAFPSLFRKGRKARNGEHNYSLQARYALRTKEDPPDEPDPESAPSIRPLTVEEQKMLLDYVLKAAEAERVERRAAITNWISVGAAVAAAIAAITAAAISGWLTFEVRDLSDASRSAPVVSSKSESASASTSIARKPDD